MNPNLKIARLFVADFLTTDQCPEDAKEFCTHIITTWELPLKKSFKNAYALYYRLMHI